MISNLNGTHVKQLNFNTNLDRFEDDRKKKPERPNPGLETKHRDSEHESDRINTSNPILSEVPNFYNREGTSMSDIPFYFTPIPKYFYENGWFKNEKTWKYVIWAFSRCQNKPHKQVIENKEITLQAYEFISGRLTSPKECFLTENEFRNQQNNMINAGFLKKTPNSLTNHYSCYIWLTEHFCKIENQQNNQPGTNQAPTVNHKYRKQEQKKTTTEEIFVVPSEEGENLKQHPIFLLLMEHSECTEKIAIRLLKNYPQEKILEAASVIKKRKKKPDPGKYFAILQDLINNDCYKKGEATCK